MTIDEAISSMKYDGELMKELEEERIVHEVKYTSDEYNQFADWLEELKAIKELDLEIPQHFTKEQSDWIKAYVILKKKEAKDDAIEEFVNEYKNFVSDEGECNLQEDCSYSGGWCIDCFKEKWMKDSKS